MRLWFDLAEEVSQLAVRSNDEGGAFNSHILLAVHRFFNPYVVGLSNFLVSIGEERKVELMLFDELGVRLRIVRADAEDNRAEFSELGVFVPKGAGFDRTSWGHILGVKIEDHRLSSEILQADLFSMLVQGRKSRGFVANFKFTHASKETTI